MPELFDDVGASEFELPGDLEALGRLPEPEPEAEQADRPRDEHGKFVSNAAVPDTEPAAEETPAEPAVEVPDAEPAAEETPAEKLLAGNFKSVDELERAYEELRSLNGRQSSELGELRKAFEERFAQIDQRLATPQAPPVQITQEMIYQDPAYATQLAVEQGNTAAAQVAFAAWKEEDPATAAAWVASKQAEVRLAEIEQRYQQKFTELEQKLVPAEEAARAKQASDLFAPVFAKDPGVEEFVKGAEITTLAEEFPETAQLIYSGSPEQQLRAVITLYEVHKGRASDNLKVAQGEVARATAEAAQQAREEAFVASATTNATGAKPSVADQIAAEWDEILQSRDAGWNIRS